MSRKARSGGRQRHRLDRLFLTHETILPSASQTAPPTAGLEQVKALAVVREPFERTARHGDD
ncbi:hypothetical protein [Micromonospora sp. DT227]|uniref:hypothetical protein n=1 Tax=Micromonospora sp. DT227 TaxID=3393433 RepID=UPI003CEE7A0C